jgi:hypothetical protein
MGRTIVRILVCITMLFTSRAAFAQRELLNPMGQKYTLAIDPIVGFRAGAISAGGVGGDGFSYAGIFGFAHQGYSAARFNNTGDDTYSTNTFWIAPSADFFVIDGLSIGGLVQLSTTSGSYTTQVNNNVTQTFDLPTTTNFTFLPRIGYLYGFTDRFGIWPRAGFGYASRQTANVGAGNNPGKESTYGFLLDIDVGFVWRPVEAVYFHVGPELASTLGANHSATNGGTTVSANATAWQFGIFGGMGAFFQL